MKKENMEYCIVECQSSLSTIMQNTIGFDLCRCDAVAVKNTVTLASRLKVAAQTLIRKASTMRDRTVKACARELEQVYTAFMEHLQAIGLSSRVNEAIVIP